MTLAAQHAAGDQDHPGIGLDAPAAADRVDALGRQRGWIEPSDIDCRRNDRDPLPWHAMACGDQLGDLVARRDHPVAARHDAVVEMLERVLLAKALVPAGEERHARAA